MLLSNSAGDVFFGVADGTRTHDDQNHNLGLYQLSYSHHRARNCSVKNRRFDRRNEELAQKSSFSLPRAGRMMPRHRGS